MTKEEAIYRLKNMAWLYGSTEREQNIEAIDMAIDALQTEPTKAVPPSLADVYKWERDIALSQLEEYGIGFAEKKRDDLVEVVRCKDCRYGEHIQIPLWENRDIDKAPSQFHDFIKCHKFHIKGFNETFYLGDDDFCSCGERSEAKNE